MLAAPSPTAPTSSAVPASALPTATNTRGRTRAPPSASTPTISAGATNTSARPRASARSEEAAAADPERALNGVPADDQGHPGAGCALQAPRERRQVHRSGIGAVERDEFVAALDAGPGGGRVGRDRH